MTRQRGRSSLFLMELILVILIFSLCASICLQLFSASQRMMRQSDALTRGVYLCETAAELFQDSEGRAEYLRRMGLGENAVDIAQLYDDQWTASPEGERLLTVFLTEDDGLITAQVTLSEADETLYTLTVCKYAPGEVWS